MGLFEAIFLAHLDRKDPTQAPTLDLGRWELAGLSPGSPEVELGRALGRPASWWSKRRGQWLYPAWSLWATCIDGKVDTFEIDLTGGLSFLLGGKPQTFVNLLRPGNKTGLPSLEEAKALFPTAEVTEDVDEIMFQVHRDGIGLDMDYDLEHRRLERVALYLDPDKEAIPIHAKDA